MSSIGTTGLMKVLNKGDQNLSGYINGTSTGMDLLKDAVNQFIQFRALTVIDTGKKNAENPPEK